MVKKRIKAQPFLDSIDLDILNLLSERGRGVLEIADKLGIYHSSLKPHIDKLRYLGFIGLRDIGEGKNTKVILVTPLQDYEDFVQEINFMDKDDKQKFNERVANFKIVKKTLEKIWEYKFDEKLFRQIEKDLDLRKKDNKK